MKRFLIVICSFFLILIVSTFIFFHMSKSQIENIICLNIFEANFILDKEFNIKNNPRTEEEIKTTFKVLDIINKNTGKEYVYKKINDKEYDIIYKDEMFDMNIEKCKKYEIKNQKEFKNLEKNLLNSKECLNMSIINNFFNLRKEIFKDNINEMNKFLESQSSEVNYQKTFNKDYKSQFYKFNLNDGKLDIQNSEGFSYNKNCINK